MCKSDLKLLTRYKPKEILEIVLCPPPLLTPSAFVSFDFLGHPNADHPEPFHFFSYNGQVRDLCPSISIPPSSHTTALPLQMGFV